MGEASAASPDRTTDDMNKAAAGLAMLTFTGMGAAIAPAAFFSGIN